MIKNDRSFLQKFWWQLGLKMIFRILTKCFWRSKLIEIGSGFRIIFSRKFVVTECLYTEKCYKTAVNCVYLNTHIAKSLWMRQICDSGMWTNEKSKYSRSARLWSVACGACWRRPTGRWFVNVDECYQYIWDKSLFYVVFFGPSKLVDLYKKFDKSETLFLKIRILWILTI